MIEVERVECCANCKSYVHIKLSKGYDSSMNVCILPHDVYGKDEVILNAPDCHCEMYEGKDE